MLSYLLIALLAYLGWAALLFVLQRSMMYPGTRMAPLRTETDALPRGVSRLWLEGSDGRVESWWLPPEASHSDPATSLPAPALIFAHGNAEFMDEWITSARRWSEAGVGVLLVEYPGYGLSEGSPTRESIVRAFVEGYDRLVERDDVDPDRVVGYGRSLGGGAVTELATLRPLRAIVLQSTYTSVASLAARSYWAPGFLVRDDFDNARNLERFDGPVLVVHGTRDRVVPVGHGRRLAELGEDVRFVELECGHNDCSPERVHATVRDFLKGEGVTSR